MHPLDRLLIATVTLFPIGFALVVWFYRSRPYAKWAKISSLIGCAAGLAWTAITLFQRPVSMQRYPFLWAISVKQMLGGIFLGIVISVGISRRYEKRVVESNESAATREV
jgi:hypothetical protein